jgi:hypothetical protein
LDSLPLAVLKVFDTVELLEGVLSHLPFKELFVLQRVSKQWGTTIAASPQLQEKMFLRLRSNVPKETWFIDSLDEPSPFGRMEPHASYILRTRELGFRLAKTPSSEAKRLYTPITLSPALQILRSCLKTPQRVLGSRERASISVRRAELDEHSSLCEMYLSDPPCCKVRLSLLTEPAGEGSLIKSNKGVKVGDVLMAASRFEEEGSFEIPERSLAAFASEQCLSVYGAESVILCIEFLRNGKIQPVIPSDEERAVATANRTSTVQPLGPTIMIV